MLIEVLVETLVEGVLQIWTDYRRKTDPDYRGSRFKKAVTAIIGVFLITAVMALFLGGFFFIEHLKPELFDIVGLD